MGLSRSARITLLLAIDIVFFFVELIAGYAVGSLALVADSFHMLNDVMSLVVALYAIKLTAESSNSKYSYGWHRAEILAALINGVFLLALCFSIFMEAIERFFSTPEITNPPLVVIVGSFGLASNLVGLFLFHEHGHSHGHSHSHSHSSATSSRTLPSPTASGQVTPTKTPARVTSPPPRRSDSRSRSDSFSDLYGHPAATRASLVQTAQEIASARSPSPTGRRLRRSGEIFSSRDEMVTSPTVPEAHETSPLLRDNAPLSPHNAHEGDDGSIDQHEDHHHTHGHGHAHSGSMNMRGVLLHVLGDALGNVGVISTGLIIWLTDWSFKYYFDPIISLVITVIIFSSALPLVRSASFILLQGVPPTVSLDDVRTAILKVEGVVNLHELHIWQLSETKIVASVHVTASRDHDFMPIAAQIRRVLHHHGIHSSTIQPEYYDSPHAVMQMKNDSGSCLIMCPADQACNPTEHACCPPPPAIA